MTDWRHDNYFGPNEFTNMKIKPVDNVYFGAHLPKKQNEMNEIQEKINEDNSRIDKGLWALSDWLKYNTESAWRNEHRLLSDHDYDYYQGVIKDARERLQED